MTINLITGIASTVIGAAYSIMAILLPLAPFGEPARHKVFPYIIGAGLIVLGLAQILLELRKLPSVPAEKRVHLPKAISRHGREIASAVAASIVYAIIFEPLGYVISTILYLSVILFMINGKKNAVVNLIVAVVFSVGIYALFAYVLGIQLPPMPLLDI